MRRLVLTAILLLSLAGCEAVVPPGPVVTPFPTTPPHETVALPSPSASPQPTPLLPSPHPAQPTAPTATPEASPTPWVLPHVFPIQPPDAAYYEDYHHDYPANDILCASGSAFVAVTNGVIDEVNYEDRWDAATDDPAWRGGRFVSLIGDDGVRYYGSHLSAVTPGLIPGQRVSAGQLLGYVGTSGDAAGTAPHLHFGISHPTRPGDWSVRRGEVDPYPYLQAWQHGQNLTPDLGTVQPALPAASPTGQGPGDSADRWTIGHSADGRSIDVYRFGQGDVRVAVIGGLHGGYEGNTVLLVQQMAGYFQDHPERVPAGSTLYLVPDANPDGYAQGAEDDGRLNGNGVDPNRNWAHEWQEYSPWWGDQTMYGGPFPFSEPETQALRNLILGQDVAAAIFYHSMGGFVTYPSAEPASSRLAECFASSTGYELGGSGRLEYTVSGDAASYLREQGIAAIDIELTDHEDPEWERNIAGFLDGLACWLD